jgi:hypothetical protein
MDWVGDLAGIVSAGAGVATLLAGFKKRLWRLIEYGSAESL